MKTAVQKKTEAAARAAGEESFFTVFVGGEMFGLSVQHTQTIFAITSVTPLPQGPADITGLVNLRGKIVTAVSLRRRLRMPDQEGGKTTLAIGIEHKGENFALIVDQVGDVLLLNDNMKIPVPPHFDPQRSRLTTGLYKVGNLLMPALDINVLFDFKD